MIHVDGATLVVVGAASRDVDAADPRGWRLGGSVTYCSMAAARLGVRVRALIGADNAAAAAWELDVLRRAGVEIHLFALRRGPIFENRAMSGGRLQIGVQPSDSLPISALPAAWRAAPALMLVPVAAELEESWADVARPTALVALGWQGLLRGLVAGHEVEPLPLRPGRLLERADLVVLSAEDAAAGGPPLRQLLTRSGQQLAVTHGYRGAIHVERTSDLRRPLRFRRLPAIPSATTDATGAGDVFLAAWCAARLCAPASVVTPWRQLAVATAAGSATVEMTSLADLPRVADLRRRLLRWQAREEGLA
jgi:sugar/nucleoside kinase (ribokinase family)